MKELTCLECKYFCNDPQFLEDTYHGLNTLSSAWGCVRGDAGICVKHQVYLFPRGRCKDFRYGPNSSNVSCGLCEEESGQGCAVNL